VDNSKLLIYHLFRFFYHLFSLLNSIGMIHKRTPGRKYNGGAFLAFPWKRKKIIPPAILNYRVLLFSGPSHNIFKFTILILYSSLLLTWTVHSCKTSLMVQSNST